MNAPSSSDLQKGLEIILSHFIQDFMRFMKKNNLSTPQIYALMYIYHAGECQVSDIGALAGVSNAAASQMVERLVQQDLVERQEDPANRRMKILKLSGKGKDLMQNSISSNHFMLNVMARLTPDQKEIIHSALSILAQTARKTTTSEK